MTTTTEVQRLESRRRKGLVMNEIMKQRRQIADPKSSLDTPSSQFPGSLHHL